MLYRKAKSTNLLWIVWDPLWTCIASYQGFSLIILTLWPVRRVGTFMTTKSKVKWKGRGSPETLPRKQVLTSLSRREYLNCCYSTLISYSSFSLSVYMWERERAFFSVICYSIPIRQQNVLSSSLLIFLDINLIFWTLVMIIVSSWGSKFTFDFVTIDVPILLTVPVVFRIIKRNIKLIIWGYACPMGASDYLRPFNILLILALTRYHKRRYLHSNAHQSWDRLH